MSTRWDSEKVKRILWAWSASIHFRKCLLAQVRALWFVLKRDFKNTINPCGISKHPVLNIYYYLMPGWDSDPVPDLRWNPLGFYGGKGGDWQHVTCLTHMWYVCLKISWTFVTAKRHFWVTLTTGSCRREVCSGIFRLYSQQGHVEEFLGYTHNRVM